MNDNPGSTRTRAGAEKLLRQWASSNKDPDVQNRLIADPERLWRTARAAVLAAVMDPLPGLEISG